MNISGMLSKTIGAVGLGLVLYDAHHAGKHHSSVNAKEKKSDSLAKNYLEDLSADSPSMTKVKIKEELLHYNMDENISGVYHGIRGYMKGFDEMLMHHAIPLVLSVGALVTKGGASKLFGAGLLAYGGLFLAQEILGIGKDEHE